MLDDCPFCLPNGLLRGEILAETDAGFLIKNETFPECYLIVPKNHTEAITGLPDDWWFDFKRLVAQLPQQPESFNLSLNFGKAAGQTVEHLHFWIVPRRNDQPSAGKGLATLIRLHNLS